MSRPQNLLKKMSLRQKLAQITQLDGSLRNAFVGEGFHALPQFSS